MVKPGGLSRKSKAGPNGTKAEKPAKSGKAAKATKAAFGAGAGNAVEAGKGRTLSVEGGETERRILAAARKEFIVKGLEGARMQAIAAEAGVNKALLHYYYRNKDRLYRTVVLDILQSVWGRIGSQLQALGPADGFEGMLRTLVSTYLRTLAANPEFPAFMLKEMTSGGAVFQSVLKEAALPLGDIPARMAGALQAEARAGRIRTVAPMHFFVNVMGMSVATFLTRPVIERLAPLLGAAVDFGETWLEQRIDSIVDMAMNGIRIRREA